MRFEDERYVRLYTRDTTTWLMLPWQSRCLLPLILRKVDRAGILNLGEDGLDGLAVQIGVPREFVDEGLPAILRRGVLNLEDGHLVWPRFIEAQECHQSDKARARAARERARDQATLPKPTTVHVTSRHDPVTRRDDRVRPRSDPSLRTVPSCAEPTDPDLMSVLRTRTENDPGPDVTPGGQPALTPCSTPPAVGMATGGVASRAAWRPQDHDEDIHDTSDTDTSNPPAETMQASLGFLENPCAPRSQTAARVFDHYVACWRREIGGKRPPKYTTDRQKQIESRLDDFSEHDLKRAIDGLFANEFNLGQNESGKLYVYPELVFRSVKQVEKYLVNAPDEDESPPPIESAPRIRKADAISEAERDEFLADLGKIFAGLQCP